MRIVIAIAGIDSNRRLLFETGMDCCCACVITEIGNHEERRIVIFNLDMLAYFATLLPVVAIIVDPA